MFNNAQPQQAHPPPLPPPPDGLSRSVSQSDHSEQSLSYLKDQSSCSSLTSGIGQSDQSICNDRVSTLDHEEITATAPADADQESPNAKGLQPAQVPNRPVISTSSAHTSNQQPRKTQSAPQYLRAPTKLAGGGPLQPATSSTNNHKQPQAMASPSEQPQMSAAEKDRLRSDIKQFVDVIFTDSQSISLERKAEFGQLMRTAEARLLFAIFVDDYRVNSKRVSELTFYSLAQYFSIVLLECLLAEDFRPAKIIMNMMFTYYYEQTLDRIPPRERSLVLGQDHLANKTVITYDHDDDYDDYEHDGGAALANSSMKTKKHSKNGDISGHHHPHRGEPKTVKTYLYTLLKDQEIFKSIRFWTSAFYESVIIERNNHPVFVDKQRGKLSNEKRDEELDCSKNITFGLLGSFIHNMCLLDLSHEFCQQFLDKHSTIAGLSDYQLEMLRANLEAMFKETSSSDKAPISQATAGERLSKFLQKLSTRLNQSNLSSSSAAAASSASTSQSN